MFNLFKNLFGASAGAPAIFHPTDTCPHCGSRLLKSERPEELKTQGAFPPLPGGEGRGKGEQINTLGSSPEWSCPNPDCVPKVRVRLEHDVPTTEEVVVGNVHVKQRSVANHAVMSRLVISMSWMIPPVSSRRWSATTTRRPR